VYLCPLYVSGNTYVDQVTVNVLRVLNFLNRSDIPVFKGASKPIVKTNVSSAKIHGTDGLGDVNLPVAPFSEQKTVAPTAIYELAKKNPGITLITLGPLTNVAMALNLYPELETLIGRIVSMGGALYRGNVTRFAEFNFYFDPEAAQFVFDSKVPLTIVPWDPILQNVILEKDLLEMAKDAGKIASMIIELQQTPLAFMEEFYGVRASVFPDPTAVAYVIDERVAKSKIIGNMKMELNGNTMRGASVLTEGERMEIITEIDPVVFKEIFVKTF
jgi:inosine-uridine nucleoside N-ribohydrolase